VEGLGWSGYGPVTLLRASSDDGDETATGS
jgi:hypothetical protein